MRPSEESTVSQDLERMLAAFHPNTIGKLVKATVYITLLINEQYTRNRRRGYLNKIAENEAYRKFIGSSKS